MAIILNHNDRCKQLVNAVDNISQNEMEEIFKMIHNHGCSYTRNNNGLFISDITHNMIYIMYLLEKYVIRPTKKACIEPTKE